MIAATVQPELITDDPRCYTEFRGVVVELKEFLKVSREMGGLLTTGQAAAILNVSPGSVRSWVFRGRLTSARVLGVVMVSAPEVLAFHRQRLLEGVSVGGRGHKAASIRDMVSEAWKDIDPLGE